MGNRKTLMLLLLLVFSALVASNGAYDDDRRWIEAEEEEESEGGAFEPHGDGRFLLHDSREIIRTDAGVMRVVRGGGLGRMISMFQSPMHIGFITMEPSSLFIPQYLDSHFTLFVRRGEVRVGHIYKDDLAERQLREGDVYTIRAGSAFYLVNTAGGQRLHIICSIATSSRLGLHGFQSFFIGGGMYPASILGGFNSLTLATAFNVSTGEVREIMTRRLAGPIVYMNDTQSHSPSIWAKFLNLEQHQKLAHLKRIVHLEEQEASQYEDEEETEELTWSLRKFLTNIFGNESNRRGKGRGEDRRRGRGPGSYNLFDRDPDYRNAYGWSLALDEHDYSPLKHSDIGVYLVNLSAGSMMAPHINPTAAEYGVVLRGSGCVQIVYPNGTLAMNARVNEGDVFWVPRFFPFCQIASRTGPFEFFGFTTSARKNRPQFLVGRNSLLQSMRGPEISAAFGISEERLRRILEAQREAVILPAASAAPTEPIDPRGEGERRKEGHKKTVKIPKVIKTLGNDMIMGFD